MTVNDAAKKWGITPRRVIALLNANRVAGAAKSGKSWLIPADGARPYDGRARYARLERPALRIAVIGINTELGAIMAETLRGNGFEVIGLESVFEKDSGNVFLNYQNRDAMLATINSIEGYLDGLIWADHSAPHGDAELEFDYDQNALEFRTGALAMNFIVRELVKKMNYQSGIVIANPPDPRLVSDIAPMLSEFYGVRINSVSADLNPYYIRDIADDMFLILTRHKYMTGMNIRLDTDNLTLDARQRSDDLNSARYYSWLHHFFSTAKPGDQMWIATRLANAVEWVDNAMERQFKQDNLDAARRGVKMTRIFVFSGKSARKMRKNQNLRDYASNPDINVLWVDADILRKSAPHLLTALGAGWGGINDRVLFVDLPSGDAGEAYGFVTMNQKDIGDAKKTFNELKKFAVSI